MPGNAKLGSRTSMEYVLNNLYALISTPWHSSILGHGVVILAVLVI